MAASFARSNLNWWTSMAAINPLWSPDLATAFAHSHKARYGGRSAREVDPSDSRAAIVFGVLTLHFGARPAAAITVVGEGRGGGPLSPLREFRGAPWLMEMVV